MPDTATTPTAPFLSTRNANIAAFFDAQAKARRDWSASSAYYHRSDIAYTRFLVPEGCDVLEVGCGVGHLLAALKPRRGVGVDLSGKMVEVARELYPNLEFHAMDAELPDELARLGGTFDVIVVSDTIGYLEDVAGFFAKLQPLLRPESRVVVAYYTRLWEPILQLSTKLGWRMLTPRLSWLSTADIEGMMALGDVEFIRREWRQLVPKHLGGVGSFINRYVAPLPGIRRLCLRSYIVGRPTVRANSGEPEPSASVLVPCRNERGNIENAVLRLPKFGSKQQIVFIEGHSNDGTFEECERVRDAYPDRDILVLRQDGKGKGDAMRKGFANATGDIVMILDADLTVPPETMGKFFDMLARRQGEFVNGTRLIYPREKEAMRGLNYVANRFFASLFSYLLNTRLTDTLCGTKAMWRRDYERLSANRAYFGDFDPFGDFDMLLGASKLNLKIVELPVRYHARRYGETQISRFRDGWLLIRMSVFAWTKLKAW